MKGAEVGDGVAVDPLGGRRHVAEGHVVEHPLAERRNRLVHRAELLVVTLQMQRSDKVPRAGAIATGRCAIGGYVAEFILCDVSGMALLSPIPYRLSFGHTLLAIRRRRCLIIQRKLKSFWRY